MQSQSKNQQKYFINAKKEKKMNQEEQKSIEQKEGDAPMYQITETEVIFNFIYNIFLCYFIYGSVYVLLTQNIYNNNPIVFYLILLFNFISSFYLLISILNQQSMRRLLDMTHSLLKRALKTS